jgi:tetratricopeptide (TPR) repeat protein
MWSTAERRSWRTLALAAALAVAGHAGAASLATEEAALARAESRDQTLHRLQAGLAALREGRLDAAAQHLDNALASIESVFSNAEGAAKARSLWYEEGAKDFKGEPYERAMAYYYRGLVYLAEGDYENARACFRSALMQSSFAEEQRYRSGFATLMFLEGWTHQLLGDTKAADSYAEAAGHRKGWSAPAGDANTLVIAELAGSPRKVGDGVGNHEIVYRRARRTPEKTIEVAMAGGKPLALVPMEDLYDQAIHRGPRTIDRIIDGKVTFQNTAGGAADALGTLASEGAVINAGLGGTAATALGGVAAIGAIASLVAVNVKPRADVRYWNNLPETLHVATLRSTDELALKTLLRDEAGRPVDVDGLAMHQWTDRNGNRLVWIKTR